MANLSASKVVQFFAYMASGLITIALLLSAIFKGNTKIGDICSNIGQAIAYIVTLIVAGSYIKGKKNVGWLVCYVIFCVSIIVLYVVNLVL